MVENTQVLNSKKELAGFQARKFLIDNMIWVILILLVI